VVSLPFDVPFLLKTAAALRRLEHEAACGIPQRTFLDVAQVRGMALDFFQSFKQALLLRTK
jgi:hypothetical protein